MGKKLFSKERSSYFRLIMAKYLFGLILFFFISCNENQSFLFLPISEDESGISFRNDLIENDSFNIIQYLYYYNGSGVGIADFNQDGLLDVVLGSNFGQTKLYLNISKDSKISFSDITEDAGLNSVNGWTTGISIADVNGDGWPDIYICQVNYKNIQGKNRLFIHQGLQNGIPIFVDKTKQYGLEFQGLSTQAAFFDYDRDGDLDMYLLNHSTHQTENYADSKVRYKPSESGDKLFRNEGGIFKEVTEAAGILNSSIGYGLGLAISDVNNDGWQDIFVGNDFHENDYLYINNQDGTFSEKGEELFGQTSQFTMGVDVADINNDGWNDIMTLDMMPAQEDVRQQSVPPDSYDIYDFKRNFGYHHQWPKNALHLNQNGRFSQISTFAGIDETDWSWSCLLADFNNDGTRDIFITNGILRRPNDLDYLNYISSEIIQSKATDLQLASKMPSGKVSNYYYSNLGMLNFKDDSQYIKNNNPGFSNGAAYADLDNDGDLDLIINNLNAPATILVNQTNTNQFLSIELKGDSLNPLAIGAKVILYSNSKVLVAENNPVKGFMSSSHIPLHFGINPSNVDSIKIIWPDGTFQLITEPILQNRLNIKKAFSQIFENLPLVNNSWSKLKFVHQENKYIDAISQKLIPWLHSAMGPAIAIADLNGDGVNDFFIGGAEGQPAGMFVNEQWINLSLWEEEKNYEDVFAVFFDADTDGDLDLVVGSGGNKAPFGSPLYMDRLYENDGNGNFFKRQVALPPILENTSAIIPTDLNEDGKIDLIVGYLSSPQNYGFSQGVKIFINQGNFKFFDQTEEYSIGFGELGMITDMVELDFDQDGDFDFLICGEWMHLTLLENKGGIFYPKIIEGTLGLWSCLESGDFDSDGDIDVIAGNFGKNNFLAKYFPGGLWLGDFDQNGVIDPIVYFTKQGEKYPVPGRDLLIKQMSSFKGKHERYTDFSKVPLHRLFPHPIKNLELQVIESVWLENQNGDFTLRQLPLEVQFSPINTFYFDQDSKFLYTGQNNYEISPYLGRQDASFGTILKWDDSQRDFIIVPESYGWEYSGQVRKIKRLNTKELLVGFNNDTLATFLLPKIGG